MLRHSCSLPHPGPCDLNAGWTVCMLNTITELHPSLSSLSLFFFFLIMCLLNSTLKLTCNLRALSDLQSNYLNIDLEEIVSD